MLMAKVVCLLISLCLGIPIMIGGARGRTIPAWILFWEAISVTGFVTLQWLI